MLEIMKSGVGSRQSAVGDFSPACSATSRRVPWARFCTLGERGESKDLELNLMACNAAKGLSQTSGMRIASAPVGVAKSTRSGFYAPLSPCGRGAGGERPAAIALLLVLSFAALTQSADP